MSEVYLISTTFNDVLKFYWPVLLEKDTLRLWYSITSIFDNFDVKPTTNEVDQCRSYDSFNVTAIMEDCEDGAEKDDIVDHTFIDYHDMRRLHVDHCDVLDSNLHTIIDQFVNSHLPKLLSRHLSNLRLITVFDITDFANVLSSLEMIKKYWLFRYKVVTMNTDVVKNKDNISDDENILIKHTLIDSLKNNLELQFKHLTTIYPESASLHTTNAFVKLACGTVGLLEELLNFN
ncbi:hypothetical protein [Mocis latipes granulovirus]|uniref:Uncharacterized protein n=1 Tax=Mocis latipes granulovirus TaxID=2072024 RepID=A0A162GWM2_9BBAC|nr:hypothetical protein [Mocis latipes granulovirus]AKR17494.1 hypothetical protein [Mocis latipes granulovirus]